MSSGVNYQTPANTAAETALLVARTATSAGTFGQALLEDFTAALQRAGYLQGMATFHEAAREFGNAAKKNGNLSSPSGHLPNSLAGTVGTGLPVQEAAAEVSAPNSPVRGV